MKVKSESEVAQSCLTPSNPMDCSLPGSSIHGIFQARVLEWGAIAFSATDGSWMLKFPIISVLLSMSPFMSVNTYFIYLASPVLDTHMLTAVTFCYVNPLSLHNVLCLLFINVQVLILHQGH